MAADTVLLHEAERGASGWRVYRWDGPWVSLGRFQRPESAVQADWDRWCVRPTGGRAVLHGHDVTFAWAMPLRGDARDLKAVYRRLTDPLIEALNACGLACHRAESMGDPARSDSVEDCFALRSPYDIVDEATGEKVCGCALRVTAGAALLQASVPCSSPLIQNVIRGERPRPVSVWQADGFEAAIASAMASR